MVNTLDENKPDNIKIFSDLPEFKINGGSIPPDIIVTNSRPDLVILDTATTPQTIYLCELTVCFEKAGNFEAAHLRKKQRYAGLKSDLEEKGFTVYNLPFEVGSRGHISLENKSILGTIHKLCKTPVKLKRFYENICKTSLLCSYAIYLSRGDPWTTTNLLSPV